MSEPDFNRLARETPWPAEEWRRAWNALPREDTWPTVVEIAALGFGNGGAVGPVAAAEALSRTFMEPIRREGIR